MRFPWAPFRRQRLRVRITLSFVATAALLTLVLALATFFSVRSLLETRRVKSATRQTALAALFAREFLAQHPQEPQQLVRLLERRQNFDALVTQRGEWFSTAPSISPRAVPASIQSRVGSGTPASGSIVLHRTRTLVFGAPIPTARAGLFLFFSLADVDATVSLLARILAITGLVVVVVAAALAQSVSRRVVRPLVGVSEAARRVAEGLLETRVQASSDDELGILAASFNEMAAALQEMIQRERRFVAAVSHELRTPLAALQTTADVLEASRAGASPAAREAIDMIAEDVGDLRRLVQDLLEISELDSAGASVRWERVDLHALATAVLRRRRRDADVVGPHVVTYSDKARLERILANLVDNAFEHGQGKMVRISVAQHDGVCEVAVADDGPGIDPEDLPHLFERFYKADRSRSRGQGGIGLGLAIASKNAELIGGSIEATSGAGRGSTFALRLPSRRFVPNPPGP